MFNPMKCKEFMFNITFTLINKCCLQHKEYFCYVPKYEWL